MAELLGLVASVIQVAGAGIQLSKTLYDYVDGVATADRRIKDIATEIKMTSIVIEELGDVFKHEETASLVSKKAVQTANNTITECSALFAQIDATLEKSKKSKLGRLVLPFRDTKLELLRSHVDKLKSTMQLLMQVLTHAYQVASRQLDRAAEELQREEIRKLLEKKDKSSKKYEELLRRDSASKGSTLVDDAEAGTVTEEQDLVMAATAIGSTINAQSLGECVEKVHEFLQNIESLQQALASARPGDDHSGHHQSLAASYFQTRAHLDQVLLGSSKEAISQPKTLDPTRFSSSPENDSTPPSRQMNVTLGSLPDLDLSEGSMGMDMDMDMNMEGGGDDDGGPDLDNIGGHGGYTPTSPTFGPTSPNHVPTSPCYSLTSPTSPTRAVESEGKVIANEATLDNNSCSSITVNNSRFKHLVGSKRKVSHHGPSVVPTDSPPTDSNEHASLDTESAACHPDIDIPLRQSGSVADPWDNRNMKQALSSDGVIPVTLQEDHQFLDQNAATKMRKRTKTGCLTCQKRRIRCGEECPTCANCMKAQRQCEGYNQRVIVKHPIGVCPQQQSGVVSTIQYHCTMLLGSRNPQSGTSQSGPAMPLLSRPLPPPPRPLDNAEPLTSATYIPDGESFGPGVGMHPIKDAQDSHPSAIFEFGGASAWSYHYSTENSGSMERIDEQAQAQRALTQASKQAEVDEVDALLKEWTVVFD